MGDSHREKVNICLLDKKRCAQNKAYLCYCSGGFYEQFPPTKIVGDILLGGGWVYLNILTSDHAHAIILKRRAYFHSIGQLFKVLETSSNFEVS